MIPFNYLGWAFRIFGKGIYPEWVFLSLQKLVEKFNENDKILDVGAGTGVLIEQAYSFNTKPEYIAVDPAYGMIKYVKDPIVKIIAKVEHLPFKDETFSMVMLGETVHHIKDLDTAFKEINRVLKSNGFLFVFDFDPDETKGKRIYRFEKLFGEPANFFPPKKLKNTLSNYGFESEFIKSDYRYILIGIKR